LSYKQSLIRLLDRTGGRSLLGKIATSFVCRKIGEGVEIRYLDGMWTRQVGSDFFPDGPTFNYTYVDFHEWKRQMEINAANTTEYWLRHYQPKRGDVIVDVGAGRGEDTATFSRLVGENGRVIAIEAHPGTFAILQNFCRLNGLTNTTILQLALMDKAGTVRMAESESSWQENTVEYHEKSTGIEVRACTLSDVCEQLGVKDIAFLKMNIEGAERHALLGMLPVIQNIRQLCVACHDFQSDRGQGEHFRTQAFVEQFLIENGFAVILRKDDPRTAVRYHVFGVR
jgi:FkbM family methyltransferase